MFILERGEAIINTKYVIASRKATWRSRLPGLLRHRWFLAMTNAGG